MNMKEVKDLIQEILQSDIHEFELEHTGTKLRLRRSSAHSDSTGQRLPTLESSLSSTGRVVALPVRPPEEPGKDLHHITSPIVGTFYRTSSPTAAAYVNVGDTVEEGTILCIIEAMKLMNEIPSDIAGEVVAIYVENGHPVEFGQKLFEIKPRK